MKLTRLETACPTHSIAQSKWEYILPFIEE